MKALLAIVLILIGAQWALAIDTAPAFDEKIQLRACNYEEFIAISALLLGLREFLL